MDTNSGLALPRVKTRSTFRAEKFPTPRSDRDMQNSLPVDFFRVGGGKVVRRWGLPSVHNFAEAGRLKRNGAIVYSAAPHSIAPWVIMLSELADFGSVTSGMPQVFSATRRSRDLRNGRSPSFHAASWYMHVSG